MLTQYHYELQLKRCLCYFVLLIFQRQKHLESIILDYQDTVDPEYDDFRTEANLQRCRQLESFSKAAEAYKQGRKEVASFYAQQVNACRECPTLIFLSKLCYYL